MNPIELEKEWLVWTAYWDSASPNESEANEANEPATPLTGGDSCKTADALATALLAIASERDGLASEIAGLRGTIDGLSCSESFFRRRSELLEIALETRPLVPAEAETFQGCCPLCHVNRKRDDSARAALEEMKADRDSASTALDDLSIEQQEALDLLGERRIQVAALRSALDEACEIGRSAVKVIDENGLDDDRESPGIRRRLAELRKAGSK